MTAATAAARPLVNVPLVEVPVVRVPVVRLEVCPRVPIALLLWDDLRGHGKAVADTVGKRFPSVKGGVWPASLTPGIGPGRPGSH
ncbi:hypothetical protein GCM10010486_72190 [Nonomuraea roseoviolacea subsp. carminata]